MSPSGVCSERWSPAGLKLTINGVYDAETVAAVKAFRKIHKLYPYSTTEATVWSLLQRGKTS